MFSQFQRYILSINLLFFLLVGHYNYSKAQCADDFKWQLKTEAILLAKNFPLIDMLSKPANQNLLAGNNQLRQIENEKKATLLVALENKQSTVADFAAAVKWNDEDRRQVIKVFCSLAAKRSVGGQLITALRNAYPLYAREPDTVLLRHVWDDVMLGINNIIDVYLLGKKPRYGAIDSISFTANDPVFRKHLYNSLSIACLQSDNKNFYYLPLEAAFAALRLNGRNEAARYEPKAAGWNNAPLNRSSRVNWEKYKYSMILVPGLGPEEKGVALDPGGARRCDAAAARFKKGEAPFLVVSGGHVHPYKTLYCEAVEMKRYLIEKCNIPDSVIFIEPHARHTTTNLRNVSRMIYWFGLPDSLPVLIVTDKSQSNYIVKGMQKIAFRDLGYLPYSHLQSLSNEETIFLPVRESMQPNPFDPLDP